MLHGDFAERVSEESSKKIDQVSKKYCSRDIIKKGRGLFLMVRPLVCWQDCNASGSQTTESDSIKNFSKHLRQRTPLQSSIFRCWILSVFRHCSCHYSDLECTDRTEAGMRHWISYPCCDSSVIKVCGQWSSMSYRKDLKKIIVDERKQWTIRLPLSFSLGNISLKSSTTSLFEGDEWKNKWNVILMIVVKRKFSQTTTDAEASRAMLSFVWNELHSTVWIPLSTSCRYSSNSTRRFSDSLEEI